MKIEPGQFETKPVLKFEMNLIDRELVGEPIRNVGKFGRTGSLQVQYYRNFGISENFFRHPESPAPGAGLTFALQRSRSCLTKELRSKNCWGWNPRDKK
jgi:hypothetical protein